MYCAKGGFEGPQGFCMKGEPVKISNFRLYEYVNALMCDLFTKSSFP